MHDKMTNDFITIWDREPSDPCVYERALLAGVLIRAVQDATGNTGLQYRSDAAVASALEWIFPEFPNSDPFSFDWICECLSMQPDFIRQSVQAHRSVNCKIRPVKKRRTTGQRAE